MTIKIGIVGVGKIARDQHIPTIDASPDFTLAAAASRNGTAEGVPNFATIEAMLAGAELDAVSLCMPPQARHDIARAALGAGKHVMLEKPPGATLSEVEDLAAIAEDAGLTLMATWHSRYAPAVELAEDWLHGKTVRRAQITWKEDVRHWHPGQAWIWQAGGLGVFDPGINALSIASAILPNFYLVSGDLSFPSNCDTPIAADLHFRTSDGVPVEAVFDFRQTGPQTWDIEIETSDGTLLLRKGGSEMSIDGVAVPCPPEAEYRGLYDRFARLIAAGESDVDTTPLRHVADAFMLGKRIEVEAFVE